jgi:hypothetical protein
MPGGLIILQSYGDADLELTGNPQTTFFKKAFRKYTHFAIEPSFEPVDGPQELNFIDEILIKHKIQRKGDLLKSMFLSITLPDIYAKLTDIGDDPSGFAFRWIDNLANIIIDRAEIFIGGNKVDNFTGIYSYMHKQLTHDSEQKANYNIITGNENDFINPEQGTLGGTNNEYPWVVSDLTNPTATLNPTIRGKEIHIPLPFWFMHDPGQSLPLVALQGHEVDIHIYLRPIIDLYQVKPYGGTEWVKPTAGSDTSIENFLTPPTYDTNRTTWNLNPRLLCHYVFLTKDEREVIVSDELRYLIKQRQHFNIRTPKSYKLELNQYNLISRIIFGLRRSDYIDKNEHTNFTNWSSPTEHPKTALTTPEVSGVNNTGIQPTNYNREILQNATIEVNGNAIFNTQESIYYGGIQSYLYNKISNTNGIYQYNFSIYPNEYQPSGSLNASRVNKLEMILQLEEIPYTQTEGGEEIFSNRYNYDYYLDVFTETYNFFTISSGLAGLKYAV